MKLYSQTWLMRTRRDPLYSLARFQKYTHESIKELSELPKFILLSELYDCNKTRQNKTRFLLAILPNLSRLSHRTVP